MTPARPKGGGEPPRVSLERALSKLGFASRARARELIEGGRVQVNGRVARDPGLRVDPARARILVDGESVRAAERVYLALYKPRGLVTTMRDEKERLTVYECLRDPALPHVVPVGRLDRESEGLLLFTNDTRWAQRVLDPSRHVEKRYEVHVAGSIPDDVATLLMGGVRTRSGEVLGASHVRRLRAEAGALVLEVTLEEGRNRQIRRMLEALDVEVVRLIRRSIGPVRLGRLEPCTWRLLTAAEIAVFAPAPAPAEETAPGRAAKVASSRAAEPTPHRAPEAAPGRASRARPPRPTDSTPPARPKRRRP